MVDHPFRQHAANVTGLAGSALLDALVENTPFGLPVDESLGDYEFNTGTAPTSVVEMASGVVFSYDPTDTTTPASNDVLVTGDGKRYKSAEGSALQFASVISIETTPPVSPSLYDAHIVGVSATGDYAGHDGDITAWTQRGWKFAIPFVGSVVLNEQTDTFLYHTTSGLWTDQTFGVADNSIRLEKSRHPMGMAVESILNTPPVSPAIEIYYIVGDTPTGAWAGQAKKVAYWDGSAWQFITAYEGAQVFDRGQALPLTYKSGAWAGVAEAVVAQLIARIPVDVTQGFTASDLEADIASFVYQGDTNHFLQVVFERRLEHTADSYLSFREDDTSSTGALATSFNRLGLVRDSETSFVEQYFSFEGSHITSVGADQDHYIMPGGHVIGDDAHPRDIYGRWDLGFHKILDANSHTYKLRVKSVSTYQNDRTGYRFEGDFAIYLWTE